MQVRKRKDEAGVPLPSFRLCIVLFAAEPEGASGEPDCSGATSASPLAAHCFQPCASTRGCPVLTAAAAAAQEGQALVPSSETCPGGQPKPLTRSILPKSHLWVCRAGWCGAGAGEMAGGLVACSLHGKTGA